MPRPPGWKWSEEVKAKMSESAHKRWTKANRKKASEFWKKVFRSGAHIPPHTGHLQTMKQKQAVSLAQKGIPKSADHVRKMTECVRKYWSSLTPEQKTERNARFIESACKTTSDRCQSEQKVQAVLRDLGIPFQSQVRFGKYTVDLFLKFRKLVIEVDFPGHRDQRAKKRDVIRDVFLGGIGLRVLRLKTEESITFDGVRTSLRIMGRSRAI